MDDMAGQHRNRHRRNGRPYYRDDAVLEVIRENGGIDYLVRILTKGIRGKRGAEFSIAALVSMANVCTANNTIAILTTGRIAKDITTRFGLDPRKTASILDTFSCMIQGLLPYGAQMLMASGLAGISSLSIIKYLFYPYTMGAFAVLAILLRYLGNTAKAGTPGG